MHRCTQKLFKERRTEVFGDLPRRYVYDFRLTIPKSDSTAVEKKQQLLLSKPVKFVDLMDQLFVVLSR